MVMDLSDETTQYMNDLAFNFAKVLYGTSEPEPRLVFVNYEGTRSIN